MDIFKDKDIKYSLDENFRVLKYGTCVADVNTCKLTGRGICNVDLVDFINLLQDYPDLTDKQVMNFSGWIYGVESQKLKKYTDMAVKAIVPNVEGNQGMVNCLNIRLRILSGVVHTTFKNHLTLQY